MSVESKKSCQVRTNLQLHFASIRPSLSQLAPVRGSHLPVWAETLKRQRKQGDATGRNPIPKFYQIQSVLVPAISNMMFDGRTSL